LEWALAIVALALLGVAAVSRRLSGTPVTPAMVFLAVGLLVGPKVLDGVDLASTSSTVRALAEATLALVLFSDASRIDLRELGRELGVPLRLLGFALPLTIALGALAAGAIFNQMTLGEALILGVILAPTDAALGQAVVTEPGVPGRIRQGLNIESGLNDGICVPLLFAAVAAADVESHISEGRSATTLLLEEIGYGVVGGVAAGLLVAAVVVHAGRRDLIAGPWRQVIPAAGAALAYGTATALDGSGFIAAFVAGMVFRAALGRDPEELNRLSEEVGSFLNGVTFLIFGAILLGPALGELSWELVLYALLSLTIVRMLPVAIAMWGSRARAPTLGFPGLVRSPRSRLDRVRRDRDRGVAAAAGAHDRARHLSHGGALGLGPRHHRCSSREPLRALVRGPSTRQALIDGGHAGRSHAAARAVCTAARCPLRDGRRDGGVLVDGVSVLLVGTTSVPPAGGRGRRASRPSSSTWCDAAGTDASSRPSCPDCAPARLRPCGPPGSSLCCRHRWTVPRSPACWPAASKWRSAGRGRSTACFSTPSTAGSGPPVSPPICLAGALPRGP
jgi:sodium/hydrogen antiporter